MEDRDIVITRIISAPRKRVWQAFIDPKDLVQWHHAGDGWTTPFAEVDGRVGGTLRIGYAGPDGATAFVLEGTFREFIPEEKMVYTLGPDRLVTITLKDEDEATEITVAFTPENENSEELQRKGWTEHYVNLEEYLDIA